MLRGKLREAVEHKCKRWGERTVGRENEKEVGKEAKLRLSREGGDSSRSGRFLLKTRKEENPPLVQKKPIGRCVERLNRLEER